MSLTVKSAHRSPTQDCGGGDVDEGDVDEGDVDAGDVDAGDVDAGESVSGSPNLDSSMVDPVGRRASDVFRKAEELRHASSTNCPSPCPQAAQRLRPCR